MRIPLQKVAAVLKLQVPKVQGVRGPAVALGISELNPHFPDCEPESNMVFLAGGESCSAPPRRFLFSLGRRDQVASRCASRCFWSSGASGSPGASGDRLGLYEWRKTHAVASAVAEPPLSTGLGIG